MKTNELLLCGSGVLAFAHIGVLRALEECGVRFATICGSSTGALIAALQANGAASSGIQNLFLNRDPQHFQPAVWFGSRNGCDARMYCPVVDLVPAEDFAAVGRVFDRVSDHLVNRHPESEIRQS